MMPTVEIVEATYQEDNERVVEHVHLLGADEFSRDPLTFAGFPIAPKASGAPTYSYERWFRMRFNPPFVQVFDLRFWTPGLVLPPGWSLLWGPSQTFHTPKDSASAIAVNPLPTDRPEEPNISIEEPLLGGEGEPRHSPWIVLQAMVSGDADVGPMLGFTAEGAPEAVDYRFEWTEV